MKISQETLKLDNIPLIRYKMISHYVPNGKQDYINYNYWYTVETGKIAIFCGWQQNNTWRHAFFKFFKVENCSGKQVLPQRMKTAIKRCSPK